MENATILAVDDEQIILNSISIVLELDGYQVKTAYNPLQALQMMRHEPPQLIISDINMPKMNGFEFYRRIRENQDWDTIPFIFLSTQDTKEDIRDGYKLGADHYLPKPFTAEDLRVAVNSRIKRSQQIRTSFEKEIENTKEQLLGVFNHELRTPLSWIAGYLSIIEECEMIEDKNIILGMQKGVKRLEALFNDLASVVNLENKNVEQFFDENSVAVDLGLEMYEAIQQYAEKANEKNITIKNNLPSGYLIKGIAKYVRDIFARIIDNAIKFSHKNSVVTILSTEEDGKATISIKDTGIGIAPHRQKELFNKLHQIDRQKHEQQGVGLGLTIAEKLVNLHKGTILIESEKDNFTCVKISFPLIQ